MSNKKQETSPLKAIKKFCRNDCCCDDMTAWKECHLTECMLHPFRMGTNPFRKKREISEEQRKAIGDRLKNARDKD